MNAGIIYPSAAGTEYIRFLHFLLTHHISAFKHVKDKRDINQQNLGIVHPPCCQI